MSLKRRLLAVAIALAGVTAIGLAAEPAAHASTRHPRAHKAGPVFPMKADEYKALMEKRIDAVRAVIDRKLDRRGVSADRKKAIHKMIDDASKDLRAEIAHAAADGTVTQAEADKVKPLATGLRAKVRARMRAEKTPVKLGDTPKPPAGKAAEAKTKPAKADKAEAHAKIDKHDAHEKADKHDAHGKPEKVAKADAPKGGATKATKAKGDAKKKADPTKHAKASPEKAASEKKKPREPVNGEADL